MSTENADTPDSRGDDHGLRLRAKITLSQTNDIETEIVTRENELTYVSDSGKTRHHSRPSRGSVKSLPAPSTILPKSIFTSSARRSIKK